MLEPALCFLKPGNYGRLLGNRFVAWPRPVKCRLVSVQVILSQRQGIMISIGGHFTMLWFITTLEVALPRMLVGPL